MRLSGDGGNYYCPIVAKETFSYVDYQIWKKIWQWCERSPPTK
ncbi:hypothetical protein EAE91_14115 [Photorhabdus noenieputensis]|nr:hypothetical protein [Photorhabdus noenieputensis]